jgi:hypothetical protein
MVVSIVEVKLAVKNQRALKEREVRRYESGTYLASQEA